MSTKIEWTDETWNPLVGCTHLGPGCDHCYAAREASGRLSGLPVYAGLARQGRFTGEVRLLPERLEQPLRWRRPRKVFVNSMSDLFHRDVPDDYIARVFAVMSLAGQHSFQVLTKGAERLPRLLGDERFPAMVDTWREQIRPGCGDFRWPLPNVWLGVSVETARYSYRIQHLIGAPATVRFLSIEPLLGPVDLWPWLDPSDWGYESNGPAGWVPDVPIHWVIVGGESGPSARPMHPDWVRTIRDQCQRAGVPFLFKQWGEWYPGLDDSCRLIVPLNLDGSQDPRAESITVSRPGKHAAGRTLDGRTWDEYPDA